MHQKFLTQAVELALDNVQDKQGGPFGAIICQNNKIIASSGNTVTQDLDPTAHAEVMAIRQACQTLQSFQLNDCILYSSCEPCPMCLGAIYWARLKSVYFACTQQQASAVGFDDSFIYQEIAKKPEHRHIPMQSLPLDNALSPFQAWAVLVDKTLY